MVAERKDALEIAMDKDKENDRIAEFSEKST